MYTWNNQVPAFNWNHGKTIGPDGTLRYLSASSLQLADTSTDQGCSRRWYYQYKEGRKEPETRQQKEGRENHALVERYLTTGERVFTPQIAAGSHMIPDPGPDLRVEEPLVPPHLGPDDLHLAPLMASGIPIVGFIDLLHARGTNKGGANIEDINDPPGTVEVLDWKFVSRLDYAKAGGELPRTIQMAGYGEWVFRTMPATQWVRLSHGYFPKTGNPRKSTIRVERDVVARYWSEHVEPLARSIRDVARETSADKVDANTRACRAFNRDCIHLPYCSAGMQQGLSALVGQTAAGNLLRRIAPTTTPTKDIVPVSSLLSRISRQPTLPPTPTPAAPDTATLAAAKAAEIAKLQAEEKAAQRRALIPAGFADMLATIRGYAKGFPQLGGRAAEVYASHEGFPYDGHGLLGTGELADVQLMEPSEFAQLIEELKAFVPDPAPLPAPPPLVAPAPTPTPASIIPPDAPGPAPSTPPAPTPTPPPEPETTPRKRGRPKASAITAPVTTVMALPVETVAPGADAINLLVDVIVEGGSGMVNLYPLMDAWAQELAAEFEVSDIRYAPDKSPLGYGKWPGAIAAMTRAADIAPGTYYLAARGNAIAEAVAHAMRSRCAASGGYWARGTL